ncbi:MlaD family protein [Dysgonomonas massiliensis]|uniref:MlaD family protein n=1 Tax=Dysgonomonas massiliensis TaxID=2040292 RepID=UPI001FEA103D|nr:MlaD family protein [Dysgonomonas massiliensis]
MKGSKEIKIGIMFLAAIAMLYFGINFLKGVNIFRPTNSYIVAFEDVTGLTTATRVSTKGLQIGQVHSIEMHEDDMKEVYVRLNLHKGVKVPVGSVVSLDNPMLGSPEIIIKMSDNTTYYTSEDTIPGERAKGITDALGGAAPQVALLIPKLDSIMTGLQRLVNDSTLPSTVSNVNVITGNLAHTTGELNKMLATLNKDVPVITGNLATSSKDLVKVTGDIQSLDIKATYASLDATMSNIQHLSDQLKSKDSSIGLLLNDRQLYDSLMITLNNASLLLEDVKKNPSRYINVKVF